jgi:hypothetical protein
MNTVKSIKIANYLFSGISLLGILSVSLLSLINPQSTMDLVNVTLDNTDAISSIRGIYGGLGLAIISALGYLYIKNINLVTRFLTLFWFSYAVSRLITLLVDGPLGDFGNQWIAIESGMFVTGLILVLMNRHYQPKEEMQILSRIDNLNIFDGLTTLKERVDRS